MYEINNRFNGGVIYKSESANNVTEAVKEYIAGLNGKRADLYGANLCVANLCGAIFAWSSHDLIAEVLRRSADGNIAKLKVAGLILLQRDWCWKEFCSLDEPQEIVDWAMRTLSVWAWEDDGNVPIQLLAWMEANDVRQPVRPKNEDVK